MMFKKIPGTVDYQININGKITDLAGKPVFFEKKNGKIKIDIFGVNKTVNLKWLIGLSWYESGVIPDLKEHLDKIRFYPADHRLRVRCGLMMQFTEPILYREGFRIIPSFPRYAINIEGKIIDIEKNCYVDSFSETTHGYISVYIRSSDRSSNKNIAFHRLVALAWIPNEDFLNKPIVNHLDGNKQNNKPENLEWCSHQENCKHAVDTGLIQSNVEMKIRDIYTGKIEIFQSAADLARKLGLSRGWSSVSFLDRLPGFLHKKRYEIKRLTDNSPWYYEENQFEPDQAKKQYYSIKVLNKKTGEIKNYNKAKRFMEAYGIYETIQIEKAVSLIQNKNKDLEISLKRNFITGPYRLIDTVEKKTLIINSIKDVAETIGINRNELGLDLRRGKKFKYFNRWIVLAKDQNESIETYQDKPKPFFAIQIKNHVNGKTEIANSIKHASVVLGITARTIDKYCKNGKRYKGYTFRPLH